jgi:protease I
VVHRSTRAAAGRAGPAERTSVATRKKILIITGDGGEGYETLYARHRFMEAGYVPVIAAPSKRRLHLVMHDFEPGWDTYREQPGYAVAADLTFDKASAKDYIAVLCIGGRAPEYLRNDTKAMALVRDMYKAGKWHFAICHGLQLSAAAGILKGRTVTCYENIRHEVYADGGRYVDRSAVRDGRIVSARTWNDHPEFYRLIFQCLSEET